MAGRSPAIFKPQPNADAFDVYNCNDKGEPDRQLTSNEPVTTCVVECVNISRGIIVEVPALKAFQLITRGFCEMHPDAWFLVGGPGSEGRPNNAKTWEEMVATFVEEVLAGFPNLFVDNSLKNPDLVAAHARQPYTGEFKASSQCIQVNGTSIKYMIGAKILASSDKDPRSAANRDYQNFKFMFANVIVHELAHLLITYLGEGRVNTPNNMRPHAPEYAPKTIGEAGRTLEIHLFGGQLGFYNTRTRPNDCGTPSVGQNDRKDWYRISVDAIENAVKENPDERSEQYPVMTSSRTLYSGILNDPSPSEFVFPYPHDGVRATTNRYPMGYGLAEDKLRNPLSFPSWPALRDAPRPL